MSTVQLEALIAHHALKMRIAVRGSAVWHRHNVLRAERVREWRQTSTLKAVR